MAHSLAQLFIHIVFSTKHRYPYLDDAGVREETHAYLAGICEKMGSPAMIVGGVSDHVHILTNLSRTCTVSDLVRELKRQSSKWLKIEKSVQGFYWQEGYGAFAVSWTHVDKLKHYIANQEAHHRHVGFEEEYRRLLQRNQVDFDERYIWE